MPKLVGLAELVPDLPELPGVPTYRGRLARRELVARYGLPNAYPRKGERLFGAGRVLFVDDDKDGRPVAFWEEGGPRGGA